jgi:hypothetical protein
MERQSRHHRHDRRAPWCVGQIAVGRSPAGRDQDPAPGDLLCKLSQSDESGDWSAEGPNGEPLEVRSGGQGLEIFWPENGTADTRQGEPVAFAMTDPIPPLGDANAGARGELPPGRGFDTLSPARSPADMNPSSLRKFQAALTAHYRRR